MILSKQEKISLVADAIRKCEKCPELVANRTQAVPGHGDVESQIVIIGESCGKTEDRDGIPFCGTSGKLLCNILLACGIERESVFITNTCRCRPPNNRTPTPEEAKNCRPFLDLELRAIAPKYIVCLGACAAQNLLGTEEKISSLRGRWHEYKGIKVRCLFHPSFALRNKAAKVAIWEDFQSILNDPDFHNKITETPKELK